MYSNNVATPLKNANLRCMGRIATLNVCVCVRPLRWFRAMVVVCNIVAVRQN